MAKEIVKTIEICYRCKEIADRKEWFCGQIMHYCTECYIERLKENNNFLAGQIATYEELTKGRRFVFQSKDRDEIPEE